MQPEDTTPKPLSDLLASLPDLSVPEIRYRVMTQGDGTLTGSKEDERLQRHERRLTGGNVIGEFASMNEAVVLARALLEKDLTIAYHIVYSNDIIAYTVRDDTPEEKRRYWQDVCAKMIIIGIAVCVGAWLFQAAGIQVWWAVATLGVVLVVLTIGMNPIEAFVAITVIMLLLATAVPSVRAIQKKALQLKIQQETPASPSASRKE